MGMRKVVLRCGKGRWEWGQRRMFGYLPAAHEAGAIVVKADISNAQRVAQVGSNNVALAVHLVNAR
jgi:hypothetical protein